LQRRDLNDKPPQTKTATPSPSSPFRPLADR
jgi:hypothetical protein